MNKKVLAAMVAVTALSVIRHNEDRHVPGTATETFETDPGTAERLVDSGAAQYAVDSAQADQVVVDKATADEAAAANKPALAKPAAVKKR